METNRSWMDSHKQLSIPSYRWQSDILNIKPFNLRECEAFAESKHLAMSRKNIMEAYMILGGILSR